MRRVLALIPLLLLTVGCVEGTEPDDTTVELTDGKGDRLGGKTSFDDELRQTMSEAGVETLDTGTVLPMDDPKVRLGQALFFDPILSGNGDVSCATCHHPELGTSDSLPLPVGVGGEGLGQTRQLGEERGFIPRNSPEIFNRGATAWRTMFWDNRVQDGGGAFYSPAGDDLPEGLDSVLAVQAMFPVTSAEEMRGDLGENEIAATDHLPTVWASLTERVLKFDGYQDLFAQAYPEVAPSHLGFQHIANAIAAYEVAAFTRANSPFDQYLAGDDDALTEQEKRGAELFFGDANCASCHNGQLLTDQDTHVIATPQFGPGKGDTAPYDEGRMLQSGDDEDRFAFRTPPLRNVELTGPYTHAGAYTTLREVVEHHLDPGATVSTYDSSQIRADIAATMLEDAEFIEECMSRVSPLLAPERPIAEVEVDDLVAFLEAMTDPSARDMTDVIPAELPSGMPVERLATAGSR